jgi:HSP20 family protein
MNSMMEEMRRSMYGRDGHRSVHGRDADGRADVGGFDANVDVTETEDGYVVVADLPGFETDDLSVRFEDGVLTIRGETEIGEENGAVARHRSRRVFERLSVPEAVVEDDISAAYHNGVLEVTLPVEEANDDDAHVIDIE